MPEDFEFVINTECGLARSGACMFSLWRGRPDMANVKSHYTLADAILTHHSKFALMLVIEPNARPPSVQAFRAIEGFYAHYGERIACLAQVVEATGFVSSAMRSAMSAILSRKTFPAKVFSKTSEAVPWVAEQIAPSTPTLQATGMALATNLKRARLAHTWQPKPSVARLSAWPPAMK